jgi:hypothetical protein
MKTAGNQLKFETARPSGRGSTLPIKLGRNLYHLRPGVTMSSFFSVLLRAKFEIFSSSQSLVLIACKIRFSMEIYRDCEKKYRGRETSENGKKWGELRNHTVR